MKSILYKIRNGKGYATEIEEYDIKQKIEVKRILKIVLESIKKDIAKNVKGKKIYIPEHVKYTLPATEKQFTGFFPSGSYIEIPKDMVFGVHWENVNGIGIDLDLSLISDTDKFGWDGSYRSAERDILFSGDITNAPKPKGATELFYVQKQKANNFIMLVNYYNFNAEVEVPYKLFVAKEQVSNMKENYVVDPNNMVMVAKSSIKDKQKILGLLETTSDNCRFYFAETSIGKSITSSGTEFVKHAKKYLFSFYKNTISLNKLLLQAGAKLMDEKHKDKCDIDLSPEVLEKDTILNLIS